MKPLFNHYGAMNEDGQDLSSSFLRSLRQFVDTHKDKYALPEMECILVSTLTSVFCEERLYRGMAMKRKEKQNEST